ncbi:sigma-54-dependent transcriptional regulator [Vibrio navarrensis]|uniref:sigma-54-dependent transcriptional regulator n=1 Tax=Vibrio navarrensis TaxID=29495 RepID=UPI001869F055|nr:sigma-54 dependent transcriptional regulator [Vibrio navarrensis]MBE4581812.1 DNA-binding response regulator [Vibrio navarrensis]
MDSISPPYIALVEDDDIVRQATTQWLQLAGFHVEAFSQGEAALAEIKRRAFDGVVSDVRLPGMDGLSLMEAIQAEQVSCPVILITGHGDVDMAVMCQLREQIARVADMDTNVIIYGETGTGKELVARSLHTESTRRANPFVAINCGAIPENLFESELFGHEAGAFTGANKRRVGKLEYADQGTLFMDEIESMPMSMQVKVLRSLQENQVERVGGNRPIGVDLRVVAAAKADLFNHPDFRQDLFYRLNVAQLHLPPLREREEDALLLFEHFAAQANANKRALSSAESRALLSYGWPGNVRELRNVAIRFALDESLSVMEILSNRAGFAQENLPSGVPLAIQLHNFERKVIHEALLRHQGSIVEVMTELDLPRRTLNQKMQKLGLNRADYTDG